MKKETTKKRRNGKKVAIVLAIIIVLAVFGGASYYYFYYKDKGNTLDNIAKIQEKAISPLTGLEISEDKKDKKPVAIMVENSKQALPQWGLSSADIIYETVVEGGITRNMAIFSNVNDVPKIGPVRSVREYYPPVAKSVGPLFVHFGGSETGYETVKKSGLDEIDGLSKPAGFLQDSSRLSRGKEHTYYTNGELIEKIAKDEGYNLNQKNKKAFNFTTEQNTWSGTASKLQFSFSNYCPASFSYDETSMKYLKREYDAAQTDGNTGNQIGVDNVLLLYADVSTQADGVHKSINYIKGGEGVYLNKGQYVDLNWTKQNDNENFSLKNSEGNDIKINSGKFWICVVPSDMKQSTKITSMAN